MTDAHSRFGRFVASTRDRVTALREWGERTLLWQVWDRMLEIEFVDRSVALAGKAFVSLFPLIIVVAAFVPPGVRTSIFTSLTNRLGIRGHALVVSKQAFASADQIRRATGILGLVLTVFFASSFTTALQRVYLRAWRRPPGRKAGEYVRGPVWFLALLATMAVLGALRSLLGNGPMLVVFAVVSLVGTTMLWWFTTWYMLMRQVRWRALLASGAITAIAMAGYAVSASIWMPNVVTKNESQFGFFGVALALVTWFSGAAIAILVGACAGAVFAADTGSVGRFIRGADAALLVDGAEPSLPGPEGSLRLRDAFRATEDEVGAT
jgi:membrane protein